jgi:gamma-glutamyl phosphate reductase
MNDLNEQSLNQIASQFQQEFNRILAEANTPDNPHAKDYLKQSNLLHSLMMNTHKLKGMKKDLQQKILSQ